MSWTCVCLLAFAFLIGAGGCSTPARLPAEAPAETTDLGTDDSRRQAARAVSGFEVADGLAVTLFASEPMLVNPTNLDVDERGRVWVCEGVNYRPQYNPQNPPQEGGDRILILEDTDGDGRADSRKVYYQGPDVNAALGIMVMGNRVIVSRSPDVLVFTDTDGDNRPDSKEILFTGVGGEQDDHGVHAFVFGPDGRLYFNFGNQGKQILDRHGQPVTDPDGNAVADTGRPYRQGMVFRVNPDGSGFEVLGHNFRNIYEVAVDAYGTLWQSDNDDDGNRAVRINYVMEYGNYGYQDELTGANWRARRTGMEAEIPARHWHQNDPGVVPNLLQTGAGSPTGILVYEGRLLPEVFRDRIIHADAGPNVVRAYPVIDEGAGYRAEIVDLVRSTGDQWFRPSDVAAAPDGSLLIADWYDPGVGGHQVADLERGRIFRVAPPGTPYRVPALDLSTPDGAAAALTSPNQATRYLAWERLRALGAGAEPALQRLWASENPRHRARALWLLARLEGRGPHYVGLALKASDPNLRIVGLRVARQLGLDVIPLVAQLVNDPSPQVRREAALALRHRTSPEAAQRWADLALRHDGRDRWYLEALGIGADGQWDRYFAAWLDRAGDGWKSPAGRDLVWRSRARAALPLLVELILDPATGAAERARYFRAFDFHDDAAKTDMLPALLRGKHPDQAQINVLALKHLGDPGRPRSPEVETALRQALAAVQGTQEYLDLVERFAVRDQNETLRRMAFDMPDSSFAVDATRLLLRFGGGDLVRQALDREAAPAVLAQLGLVESQPAREMIETVLLDPDRSLDVRRAAVAALGRSWSGEERLLALVKAGQIPDALRPAAASILLNVWRSELRREAERYLDQPGAADEETLPPIRSLAAAAGNPAGGAGVFRAHCSACHRVRGEGVDFGPDLSEIGGKLSKEALFVAILHPDAGISFGYEGLMATLRDGTRVVGYVASETEDVLELRVAGGLTRRYARSEVASRTPLGTSLMPSLQRAMTRKELVDLVAYLHTLRKEPG